MQYSSIVTLALCLAVSAHPMRRAAFDLKNGQDAIALNDKFKTLTADSPCAAGENACVGGKFAQCVSGKYVIQACGPGTTCVALPLVGSAGTSVTCDTEADTTARIAATGAKAAAAAPPADANDPAKGAGAAAPPAAAAGDIQSSLTLDPSVIAKGFTNDGQSQPEAGQVASLTSSNNFINFCATFPNLPITNGLQTTTGSCNPAPMGAIPSTKNMPSSKFVFPKNGGTITADTKFTIQMAIKNIQTGNFVNAKQNYYAAPQQLNKQGVIIGHSHVVVEKLTSLDQTTPTDPNVFAFFKGLNTAAANGVLSADVEKGLPAGVYKLSSINAAANHQPVLAPIAQHGSLDDAVYFTVTADGVAGAAKGEGAAAGGAAAGAGAAKGAAAAGAASDAKGAKGAKA